MTQQQIRKFRYHLRKIERNVSETLKDQTSCCGITMAQCHVLLEFKPGDVLTNTELSSRLGLDTSTLSRTVDSLVRSGMVDRSENPENRRSSRLQLTNEGIGTLNEINKSCDCFYNEFFNRIPDEKHGQILESIEILSDLFLNTKGESL